MFSNTRINWTIDPQFSEIFFRMRYFSLEESDHLNNPCNPCDKHDATFNDFFETLTQNYFSDPDVKHTRSELYLRTIEIPVSIDYNVIIFDDKNPNEFWKRKTFSGLLVFTNIGKKRLITLQHFTYAFDNCGRAAAIHSVKGKLNKEDFDLATDEASISNEILLKSELLFEGCVRLIQEK